MRLLRAADRAAQPWKNGGGLTREVAAFPDGAGFEDFAWRVSMAEVRADGPFSLFPDVDRILAVLAGRFRLTVAGETFDLAPGGTPAEFPGDRPAAAQVLDGPVLDLNVMTRRGRASAQVERVVAHLPAPLASFDGATLLVPAEGSVRVVGKGEAFDLERFDAVLVGREDGSLLIEAGAPALVYAIRVSLR